MLLVYLEPLVLEQRTILTRWDRQVRYWPRSYAHTEQYNAAIPTDWWLLFSAEVGGAWVVMMYPEQTRIVGT